MAQEQPKDSIKEKVFSLGISYGMDGYCGNSFLSKSYEKTSSVRLDMTFPIVNHFGFGFLLDFKKPKIKDTQYIGNSSDALMTELGVFGTYQFKMSEKVNLFTMAGISNFNLRNTISTDSQKFNYRSKGFKIFIYPELNYAMTPSWNLFLQGNVGYINLHALAVSNRIDAEYNHHLDTGVRIGLRFKYN